MDKTKQIGKTISALLLFAALMLPTAVQLIHTFEGHQHVACTEQSTHIHKSVTKCETCSFNFASFDYEIANYTDVLLPKIPEKINVSITSLRYHSFTVTNTQLRAPPYFS